MTVHELTPRDARRIAVRAQLLDRRRPAALLDVVRQLTLIQIDPTAAVAPSADLVAWSRLGSSYAPAEPAPPPGPDWHIPAVTAESTALAKALKKAGFVFVGPTTCYALMQACGLVDDHVADCHVRLALGGN